MGYGRHLGAALMALASFTACDDAGSPTRPEPSRPPVVPVPTPTVNGEITVRSIAPAPGAVVPARPCARGSSRWCADQPQMTFDVVVEEDIPNATLTVSFGGCGYARTPVTALTVGTPTLMTTSVIDLSDDGPLHDGVGAELYCGLPAVTTKMIVSLWRSGSPAQPLLTREFANGYTFAMPQ